MKWSNSIRRTHRWLSVIFVLAFLVVTGLTLGSEEPAEWVYLLPLLPLFLLTVTGLYLFGLPYASKRRGNVRAG